MVRKIVDIQDLVKTYENGRVKALNGVNLEVYEGDFIAIMGPSGSGKTTLLNIIGGLDRPDFGRVIVDGVNLCEVKSLDEFRAKTVGFVFQLHNLIPVLTASENVQIPMFEQGLPNKERIRRAEYLLKLVGLEHRKNFLPTKLSGGERQRVAITRALANNPKILLADEPTGNLDRESSKEIMKVFLNLNKKGLTIIIVTHDPEIANCAQKIHILRDGKIVATKKPDPSKCILSI